MAGKTAVKEPAAEAPRKRTKIRLQARRNLADGYVLDPHGATVNDAVRSADISNHANRQRLARKGFKIMSRHNFNDTPREFKGQTPTLERCAKAIEIVNARKGPVLQALRAELEEAEDEVQQQDLGRTERGYWRTRVKTLKVKIAEIEDENVTAQQLFEAFLREDVKLRSREIDPATRAMVEALRNEEQVLQDLGPEDGAGGDGWQDPDDPFADELHGNEADTEL